MIRMGKSIRHKWVNNAGSIAVGKCYYQGKEYSQSQTWDDGCAYECTCDNAAQGRYSCYNK